MINKVVRKKKRLTQKEYEQIRYDRYVKKVDEINNGRLLGRVQEISSVMPKKSALRLLQPYSRQIDTVVRKFYKGDRKKYKDLDYSVKKIVDFAIRKNLRKNEQL